jgi:hypothetical protein
VHKIKCIQSAGFCKNQFIVEVMSVNTDLKFTVVQVKDLVLESHNKVSVH